MSHPVRFGDDDVQKTVGGVLGDVSAAIPQGLGVAADIGQRCAQLMGHIGHELLAPLLVAVLLGHVVEHDQHAAAGLVGEGGQIQLQRPVSHHHLTLGVVGPLEG